MSVLHISADVELLWVWFWTTDTLLLSRTVLFFAWSIKENTENSKRCSVSVWRTTSASVSSLRNVIHLIIHHKALFWFSTGAERELWLFSRLQDFISYTETRMKSWCHTVSDGRASFWSLSASCQADSELLTDADGRTDENSTDRPERELSPASVKLHFHLLHTLWWPRTNTQTHFCSLK